MAQSHRRSRMAKLLERVAMQHLELITRFDHHHFPIRRNAEEPAINPDRGAKETTADPLLVFDLPTVRVEAGHYSRVAPKPGKFPDRHTGGDVWCRLLELVSKFRGGPP